MAGALVGAMLLLLFLLLMESLMLALPLPTSLPLSTPLAPSACAVASSAPAAHSAPALLCGYGAYGINTDAEYDPPMLSLLTRGWLLALAHVRHATAAPPCQPLILMRRCCRGGSELGRRWYDAGRLLHKRNSMLDFVSCAEHLVARGLARRDGLAATAASAGGLMLGAPRASHHAQIAASAWAVRDAASVRGQAR